MMDGQRFDAWTRVLTRGISRRGTLKTVAGVALAGATARTALLEAEATPGGHGECLDYGFACSAGECCECCRAGNPSAICGDCLPLGQWCVHNDECASKLCEFKVTKLAYVCSDGGGKGGNQKAKCDGNGCNKKHGKKHDKNRGRGKHRN